MRLLIVFDIIVDERGQRTCDIVDESNLTYNRRSETDIVGMLNKPQKGQWRTDP
jgi:hypothetical protein